MNWYKELVTYEALGLEYDKVLGKYPVVRLMSATELLNPRVSNYSNIVVEKQNNYKLYDVTTDVLDNGDIKIFARHFGSVRPYTKTMTKDIFVENYIIVNHTQADIKKMLKERKNQDSND